MHQTLGLEPNSPFQQALQGTLMHLRTSVLEDMAQPLDLPSSLLFRSEALPPPTKGLHFFLMEARSFPRASKTLTACRLEDASSQFPLLGAI